MAFLFRWVMRVILFAVLFAIAAAATAYYLAGRSLPDYDATWQVDGVDARFEIVRDRNAVPHILATTDRDAFFGLGFVHAQDRLWQMILARRTAQGRLSELFGPETVGIDELMRALDIYGVAREASRLQDAETLSALEAYSNGVNAWLRQVQDQALGRGAPEFFLFDAAIAPWIPADSIAVQKLMALQLSDKAAREALRARLSLVVEPERLEDIMPEAPNAPVLGLPDFAEMFPTLRRGAIRRTELRHPLDPLPSAGFGGASNAFAAAAGRSAAGASLLANDPHLALTAPSIWYLARMDLAAGPAIGGTIPGIPVILSGRNDILAWGLTSSHLDDQDVYIEKLDPDDAERYLTPEGYVPFVERRVTIRVKDAADEARTLRRTQHGPVIPAPHFGVAEITPPGHVASLAWTGFAEEDRSIAAGIALMRARSIREGREATKGLVAPSQMVTLADADGVALQMAGAAPARLEGHTSRGRIPAPGWLGVNDWQGMRPASLNPWVIDPPGGIVVNTNNRITDAVFPDHLSYDWGDAFRIVRAGRLLGVREFHSLDSFVEIQTDTVSEAARTLLPLIARDLWYSGETAEPDSPAARRAQALERLANWNGEMSEHAPEPLIYAAWVRALQRRLAIDELGAMVDALPAPDPVFIERVFRNVDGAAAWCDVRQTPAKETCPEMARRSLDDSLQEIAASFGPRLESWRWGDAHQALHTHQTLGRIPVLEWLVNIRQSTPGGDQTLLRGQMAGNGPEPYISTHAAGLRLVHDFSDPDSSLMVIATGQSGHPLSRHYDDLSALWRRSEYVPMSLDASLARAGQRGVTWIEPAGAAALSE